VKIKRKINQLIFVLRRAKYFEQRLFNALLDQAVTG
jgi:hypothetical protein